MTLFINDFCNHSCIFFSFKTRILIFKKGEKLSNLRYIRFQIVILYCRNHNDHISIHFIFFLIEILINLMIIERD